jgi:signal transduction histidine kinase
VNVIPGDSALALFTRIAKPTYGALPALGGLFLLTLAVLAIVANVLRREAEAGRRQWSFATSVSHELRTPLAQILLFAERLRERARLSKGEANTRHELDVIVREAERMRYLVENVLHVARNDAPPLRTETGRVAPIVEEVVDRYQALVEANGVTLELNVERDVVAVVERGAVEQILLNLLDNAAKHAGPGEIRVGVGELRGRAAIWVDDAGKGIPMEERARIWDPFVRGARARGEATAGTGLGLSVVRDLAAALGWQTEVDTSPAGGARMILWPGAAHVMAPEEEGVV